MPFAVSIKRGTHFTFHQALNAEYKRRMSPSYALAAS